MLLMFLVHDLSNLQICLVSHVSVMNFVVLIVPQGCFLMSCFVIVRLERFDYFYTSVQIWQFGLYFFITYHICMRCPANARQIHQATLAMRTAIKEYGLMQGRKIVVNTLYFRLVIYTVYTAL